MLSFSAPIPLNLYIHIPWCVKKCPYCDFNSHKAKQSIPEEEYIQALTKDLEEKLPEIWGRRLISIFFGGGTPSLFSASAIEKILTMVHSRLNFGSDIEVTLEANPGTIDENKFKGFKKAGVNRLSIGLQSLQNEKLKLLGRIHDRDHALSAIEKATNAGFTNFNLDLMHGLPNQSVDDALADLKDALNFSPPHLSWYQLTIEPNTLFHNKPPLLPHEDTLYDIQNKGIELLTNNNMQQYEVSAYSKPNHECQHNLNYWQFGDYLGIGAGAHSKITDVNQNIITRHWQVKNPKDYLNLQKSQTVNSKILERKDIVFEFMLNALRLNKGFDKELFETRTGVEISFIEPTLKQAQDKRFITYENGIVTKTQLGARFLNDVVAMFL